MGATSGPEHRPEQLGQRLLVETTVVVGPELLRRPLHRCPPPSGLRDDRGSRVALQGNLDPSVLYAPPAVIRAEVELVLESFGTGHGHVFNLGHGIHPDVPPEHAAAMIAAVHELSPAYHA